MGRRPFAAEIAVAEVAYLHHAAVIRPHAAAIVVGRHAALTFAVAVAEVAALTFAVAVAEVAARIAVGRRPHAVAAEIAAAEIAAAEIVVGRRQHPPEIAVAEPRTHVARFAALTFAVAVAIAVD